MFTFFHGCGIPPVTLTCHQGGGAQAQTLPTILPTSNIQCLSTIVTMGGCNNGGGSGAQAQTLIPTTNIQCLSTIVTMGGGHNAGAQAQTLGPTAYQGCGTIGTTGTQNCTILGPTGTQGCTLVGQTGWYGCGQGSNGGGSGAQAQTLITTATIITALAGCMGGAQAQAQTLGPTAYQGCGSNGNGTAATLCTYSGCGATHLLGCTGYEGCHSGSNNNGTAATVCTQIGCDANGGAQAQVRSIPVADCIPTKNCTGAWPVC